MKPTSRHAWWVAAAGLVAGCHAKVEPDAIVYVHWEERAIAVLCLADGRFYDADDCDGTPTDARAQAPARGEELALGPHTMVSTNLCSFEYPGAPDDEPPPEDEDEEDDDDDPQRPARQVSASPLGMELMVWSRDGTVTDRRTPVTLTATEESALLDRIRLGFEWNHDAGALQIHRIDSLGEGPDAPRVIVAGLADPFPKYRPSTYLLEKDQLWSMRTQPTLEGVYDLDGDGHFEFFWRESRGIPATP